MIHAPNPLQDLIDANPILQNVECGVYIGDGWLSIIEKFCKVVERHIHKDDPPVVIGQIKEKFGGLRVYVDVGDEYIRGAATMAEMMSWQICEDCGETGKVRAGGWIRTLCDVCEIRQKKLRDV